MVACFVVVVILRLELEWSDLTHGRFGFGTDQPAGVPTWPGYVARSKVFA